MVAARTRLLTALALGAALVTAGVSLSAPSQAQTSGALERTGCILGNGPEEYDAFKAGPRVVHQQPDGTFVMLYEAVGSNGTTTTARAVSPDGYAWTKQGVVLRPELPWERSEITPGSLLVEGTTWRLWYHAGGQISDGVRSGNTVIGLATSLDGGRTWVRFPAPVLANGPEGSPDALQAAEPRVVRVDEGYRMYYTGQSRAGARTTLNLARSTDGLTWTKSSSNPLLSARAWGGQWGGAFFRDGSGWRLWHAVLGSDRRGQLHYATSQDGLVWRDGPDNPVLTRPSSSAEGDGEFLGDSVSGYQVGGQYRVLYTGYTTGYPGQGRFEGICSAVSR